MKKPVINNIFPIPIYTTSIERGFTKQELQFVNEQKKHYMSNTGNINTKDNYILNRKEFKNIKKFLDKCCKDYLDTIICPKNNVELYITQSLSNMGIQWKDDLHMDMSGPAWIVSQYDNE